MAMNRFGDIDASNKRLPPVYGYRSEKLVTLEKALEPIVSEIDELPYYIKIAKKYCHFPSEHGLTHDQSAAVYIYTMEWGETTLYRVLNNALRSENRHALKIWFPYLKLLDTALDKLPTVKEGVWRGVPLDIGKKYTREQMITWWSINSCSSSPNVIKDFLGNNKSSTIFLIEAINGKKVSGYTEHEQEEEVILRLGSEFRVKGDPLKQEHGSYLVHLVEMDDNNDQSLASSMHQMQLNPSPPAPSVSSTDSPRILNIPANARWAQNGVTVAGGNGPGDAINQLKRPWGVVVDDDQTVIIADTYNDRIIQWRKDGISGQVIAGTNGNEIRSKQLKEPTDVLIDKETDSLIITDWGNQRVIRWSRRYSTKEGEILIDNITGWGLALDDKRYLYVSDTPKHEVRRFRLGDKNGVLAAGGKGVGNGANQLNAPGYLFVDRQQNVYVSDRFNHRVMKWNKYAQEGIVVAGGKGQENVMAQLNHPNGIFVDTLGTLYVADQKNNRVMRWTQGDKQGTVIVGGNGSGAEPNQFNQPTGLCFDRYGNLYVVDLFNDRVQRFDIMK